MARLSEVSVGVAPTKYSFDEEGVMLIQAADWLRIVAGQPASVQQAVITQVAASIPQEVPDIELNEVIPTQEMPATPSKTFIRPTITTHTSAAVQTENAAASATTMVIASNVVTKTTVAGQVTITQQDMDFTDPAAMNLILNDLAGEYMIKTDDIAADALVAGKTASGSTWTVTAGDPTSLIDSLYDAAREIAEDSNYFPTHLCVSPDVWEKLGSQLDANKRPVLGYVTDGVVGQNSLGKVGGMGYNNMNVMGLQLVVDNNFASGTMLVCYAPGFEIYEAQQGVLSVALPSTLARNFSYYGYFATFVAKSSFIQGIVIA
jgi:hypothetical protein